MLLILIFVNLSPEPTNLLAVISPFISKSFVAKEKTERVVPNGVILSDII